MPAWLNVPNLLTLVRLLLVPFVIRAILNGQHLLALSVFGVAAVTDVLDGWAARHFGVSSKVGAYFDPIADKALMSGVFLALALAKSVPWWFVAIVFGRDIYILLAVLILLMVSKKRDFPPSMWGKISTFVQIVTAVVVMAQIPGLEFSTAILLPCVAFTVWSGVHYTWRGVQVVRAD
jgi:cardiolipin synthase